MLLSKKIPILRILQDIKYEVLYVLIVSFIVYNLKDFFSDVIPEMPIAIPAFLGTAISVILSFKLNQSYDRWWESRKIWGAIVNESRNLVMQLQLFLANGDTVRRMAYRHIGWCYALGQNLRGLDPLTGLEQYLPEEDLQQVRGITNKPMAIVQLNMQELAEARDQEGLDSITTAQINNTMINLVNAMGMAERIKGTVFPITYSLFLHMFIYLFVITLSVSLRNIDSHYEIPLLLVIAAVFFLLEKTATQLQDPFSNKDTDTAVTAIAANIEVNVRQLLGEDGVKPVAPATAYYVM